MKENIELQQHLQCCEKEKENIREKLAKANDTIRRNQRQMLEMKHETVSIIL